MNVATDVLRAIYDEGATEVARLTNRCLAAEALAEARKVRLDAVSGYLNWTEDEFHLSLPEVRATLRRIVAGTDA